MIRENQRRFKFDWLIIIIYLILVSFGYINIMSASHSGEVTSYLDMSQSYGKQLIFLGISVVLIILILSVEAKFYERFSSIIYSVGILSLLGLFIFGKDINGARSWYGIGSMTIQPSEFAKFATALALAKYLSDIQTNLKTIKDQIKAAIIVFLPAFLILLQNDAGSTLVFASFFFVFYREGLQQIYLIIAFSLLFLAILALKYGVLITLFISAFLIFGVYFYRRRRRRTSLLQYISVLLVSVIFAYGVQMFYSHALKPHQQNRISLG